MGGSRGQSGAGVDPSTERDVVIADTGMSLAAFEAMLPHLGESLMIIEPDWTVRANLAPPGGLIGQGIGLGEHTLAYMHPDDALSILDLGNRAFETEPGWEGGIDIRMLQGNGEYAPYRITAVNRLDDPEIAGMVVRTQAIVASGLPSTPDLHPSQAIEVLSELLPTGVLLLDGSGAVVFANSAACTMFGHGSLVLSKLGLDAVVDPADRSDLEAVVARVIAAPSTERCTVRLAAGAAEVVECRFASAGAERVTFVVVAVLDVTEHHAERRDLVDRATRDPLTGVTNRAGIVDALTERLRSGTDTVVAFLDLDGFKAVNDDLGHVAGDRVLAAVARSLVAGLGPEVLVGRIGGDEFVAVGDRTDLLVPHARAAVERCEAARRAGVGASIGIARAAPGDDAEMLLHRADQAMYVDKRRTDGTQAR